MAVLSVCRNFGSKLVHTNKFLVNQIRDSGHGRQMFIKPSQFQWRKFKDMVHLYSMVGLIPMFCWSSYLNLTIGPSELAETPEGYRPEYYEYQRHPVTRWMTKHFHRDPQVLYELRMAALNFEAESVLMKRISEQVTNVMKARQDYQAWFYWPFYAKHARRYREIYRTMEDRTGTKDPVILHEKGGLTKYQHPIRGSNW